TCSSSVRNPADLTASASSLILEDCRAFILAAGRSGRWVRACTRAAEDGRNTSDECECMHRFPLNWPQGTLQSNVRADGLIADATKAGITVGQERRPSGVPAWAA